MLILFLHIVILTVLFKQLKHEALCLFRVLFWFMHVLHLILSNNVIYIYVTHNDCTTISITFHIYIVLCCGYTVHNYKILSDKINKNAT